jgi:hypothetical protein
MRTEISSIKPFVLFNINLHMGLYRYGLKHKIFCAECMRFVPFINLSSPKKYFSHFYWTLLLLLLLLLLLSSSSSLLLYCCCYRMGWGSILGRRWDFSLRQHGYWAHPASHPMDTGSKMAEAWKLKLNLKYVNVRIEFSWLRIGFNNGLLWTL